MKVVSVTITVSTSPGGLLVPEDIIPTVVSVTITVSTSPGGLLVPEDTVIVTLTTGGMIPSGTNIPQKR
jgi:Flp pilus assembly protein CpaB